MSEDEPRGATAHRLHARPAPSLEQIELDRRFPVAQRELEALVRHLRDLRLRQNPEPLPPAAREAVARRLRRGIRDAVAEELPPGVSRGTARRMAAQVSDFLLGQRISTTPVVHELIALAPWWISHLPGEVFPKLRDIGLRYVLNGHVRPIQVVWRDVLSAEDTFLGHCTCRSAGIVDDLADGDGRVISIATPEVSRRLADRLVARYRRLVRPDGSVPDTHARYAAMLRDLDAARRAGSEGYGVEAVLRATYPDWEILPVGAEYTPAWVRSMHANRKAFEIHRELLFELVNVFFLARGIVFSTMNLFDTAYAICSCPSPEHGGGCVLTNWYYGGGSESSLLPSEEGFGRRRTPAGDLQPCSEFPLRAHRACIGCGCRHGAPAPRGVDTVLAQADEVLPCPPIEDDG